MRVAIQRAHILGRALAGVEQVDKRILSTASQHVTAGRQRHRVDKGWVDDVGLGRVNTSVQFVQVDAAQSAAT